MAHPQHQHPENKTIKSRPQSQSAVSPTPVKPYPSPLFEQTIQKIVETPEQLTGIEANQLQRTLGNQAVGQIDVGRQPYVPDKMPYASLQAILTHSNHIISRRSNEAEDTSVADSISDQDIQYEIVAHHIAYQDTISPAAGDVLARWGYQREWHAAVNDGSTGFFVGLIMPDEAHPDLTPVLAFRGTEPSQLGDIVADLHPGAVGQNQFRTNQRFVAQLISEAGGKVNVTGHSLGGALAQFAAASFPGSISRVVTFQAPGISASQAEAFSDAEERPEATHHIAMGDIVDVAGSSHLEGEFYSHSPGGIITPHVKFLLTTPEFKERREALGLDEATLAELGIETQENKQPIGHSETYPHNIKSAFAETGRTVLGAGLYPILDAINTLIRDDDSDIRDNVAAQDAATLAQRPTSERSYMIRRLSKGVTFDADEATILAVLEASVIAGDVVQVMNIADAWDVCYAVDGDEYDQLRAFLNKHYYADIEPDIALALIQKCMDGATAEWEEEMIADILVGHPDGRYLISRIGAIYEGGGFNEGLNKVEWQLDGSDQKRVEAVYGESQ